MLSVLPPSLPVPTGNTLTYTLTLSNQGPNTAQNVVLTQTVPPNSSYISSTSSSGTNSPTGGGLVSSPLIIPAGGIVTVTVNLQTLKAGVVKLNLTVEPAGAMLNDVRVPVRGERVVNQYGPINGAMQVGVQDVDSDLATLLRTCVVVIALGGLVIGLGKWSNPAELSSKTLLFLVLSGLATAASWLCAHRRGHRISASIVTT